MGDGARGASVARGGGGDGGLGFCIAEGAGGVEKRGGVDAEDGSASF